MKYFFIISAQLIGLMAMIEHLTDRFTDSTAVYHICVAIFILVMVNTFYE